MRATEVFLCGSHKNSVALCGQKTSIVTDSDSVEFYAKNFIF